MSKVKYFHVAIYSSPSLLDATARF